MAVCYEGQRRFQLGLMDDAAECFVSSSNLNVFVVNCVELPVIYVMRVAVDRFVSFSNLQILLKRFNCFQYNSSNFTSYM